MSKRVRRLLIVWNCFALLAKQQYVEARATLFHSKRYDALPLPICHAYLLLWGLKKFYFLQYTTETNLLPWVLPFGKLCVLWALKSSTTKSTFTFLHKFLDEIQPCLTFSKVKKRMYILLVDIFLSRIVYRFFSDGEIEWSRYLKLNTCLYGPSKKF